MSGTDTANVISFSKLPTSVPSDYMALLTRLADDYTVMPGPGGSVIVLARGGDSIGASIAEAGIEFSRSKTEVRTNDPKLDEPNLAGLGLWSMALATSLTSVALNPPLLEQMLFGGGIVARKGEETLASSLGYIRQAKAALAEEEGAAEEPQPEQPPILTLDPMSLWLGQIKETAGLGNQTMTGTQEKIAIKMKSVSSSDVREGLVSLSGLSETEVQPLLPHLTKLADTMSMANLGGGPLVLSSPVGLPIAATLLKTVDAEHAPEDLKEPLAAAMYTIGNGIAKLNFEQCALDRGPSDEYSQLTSQDPQQLASLLQTCLKGIPHPADVGDADLQSMLDDLAKELTESGYAAEFAESPDITALTSKLKNKIDELAANGEIPLPVASFALTTLLPELASKLTAIVHGKLTGDLRSSNPSTVSNAIQKLTFKASEPPPKIGEMYMYQNYMQVLTAALVFMSQIRATIISLESKYEQALSAYQLQNVGIQSDIATKQMQSQLTEISTKYADTLHQIETQKWERIFFPLIAIIVTVVALIIVIASFVATAATAGAGSPLIGLSLLTAQQLIGFAVGIVVSSVSVILTVADAVVTWASAGQTSMWAQFAKAFGITSQEGIAIFTAITNLIILIVVAIATMGVGLIAVALKGISVTTEAGTELVEIGAEVGVEEALETTKVTGFAAVKSVVQQMIKEAPQAAKSLVGQQLIACFIAAAFNGGAVTMVLQDLLKAMKLDDKTTAILSMLITVVLMLVITMVASGRMPDIFKSVKSAVTQFIKAPLATITDSLASVRTWITDFCQSICDSLGKMAKRMSELKQSAQDFLESLKIAPTLAEATAEAASAGIQEAHSMAYWVLYNLIRHIKNAIQSALQLVVQGFIPASEWKEGENILIRVMGAMTGPVTYTLQVAEDGMKIASAVIQYQAARVQQQIQEQMSQLELETSSLTALVDYFGNLQGINPEALIAAITDSTQAATEQWNDFVQLVDTFFVAAARSVSKATAESAI